MTDAQVWAERLASGARVLERVVVVVAHPDDETLWAGALLQRLSNGLVIHLTDGAPADMADAQVLGFATREAYAKARAEELNGALATLGYAGERRSYGVRDKAAVFEADTLIERLTADLADAAVVISHPYEGGHPDHDAAALAVRRAADRAGIPVVEFGCYHQRDGERLFGCFWPDAAAPEHVRAVSPSEAARIDAALAAHATQAAVFGDWRPSHERWRAAPRYDFTAPPPPDAALYDGFGWAITSERWRAAANATVAA